MFEHIVLRRAENGLPISAGQLAESMLYYQKVHLIIDRGTLSTLVRQLGTPGLMSVVNRKDVSAVYCEEMLGTHTESVGVTQYHNYLAFQISGGPTGEALGSTQERLQFDLERDGISESAAKKFARAFISKVPVKKYSTDYFTKGGVPRAAERDLEDEGFVKDAVRRVLENEAMDASFASSDFKFELLKSELGNVVFTNLDLDHINRRRREAHPARDPLTVANLLSSILDARADLAIAAHYGGDFVTSSVTSSIIQLRHADLLRRAEINVESRDNFANIVLPDMPSLAEVIDSGERSFDDFLRLLDGAWRFKDWLKSANPDENLVRTYLRDVTSEGWIQGIQGKTLRYVLTSVIGGSSPLGGLAVGFVDSFIIDKLLGGWKPNHFISSKLTPFVKER